MTGIPGLIARSAARFGERGCGDPVCPPYSVNKCFLNSTAMPGYVFMAGISSDSLTGMVALEGSRKERKREREREREK